MLHVLSPKLGMLSDYAYIEKYYCGTIIFYLLIQLQSMCFGSFDNMELILNTLNSFCKNVVEKVWSECYINIKCNTKLTTVDIIVKGIQYLIF